MLAAKQDATMVRPTREYPTEWTWYPADEEDYKRQKQRSGELDDQADAVRSKRDYPNGRWQSSRP